jgi:hypothetical protein
VLIYNGLPEDFSTACLKPPFYVAREMEASDEVTVGTIGWGPYYIEIVIHGRLLMKVTDTAEEVWIHTTEDLKNAGITTDIELVGAMEERYLDTFSFPVFRIKVDGLVGKEDEFYGGSFYSIDEACRSAQMLLREYLAHSMEPIPF